jgi:hypothetical protein
VNRKLAFSEARIRRYIGTFWRRLRELPWICIPYWPDCRVFSSIFLWLPLWEGQDWVLTLTSNFKVHNLFFRERKQITKYVYHFLCSFSYKRTFIWTQGKNKFTVLHNPWDVDCHKIREVLSSVQFRMVYFAVAYVKAQNTKLLFHVLFFARARARE